MRTSGKIISTALAALMVASSVSVGISASAATVKKPTKVTVKNTAKGVKISWKKVKGAKYKVYRGKKLLKTVKKTTYTDKKAKKGKTYTYKVKAVKGKTTSKAASKKATRLAKPTLTVAKTATAVKASWKKVKGATKYVVYKKAASAKKYTKLATTTKKSYTDKKVSANTKYSYKVRAYAKKTKMYSVYSKVKSVTFLAAPVVDQKNPFINKGAKATISWKAVQGATSYEIYTARITDSKTSKIATVTGTSYELDLGANPTFAAVEVYAKSSSAKSVAAQVAVINLPTGSYFTDADKNVNVNLNLKAGESYKDGSFLVGSMMVLQFADKTVTYDVKVVEGADVITVDQGAITAVKAGTAKIEVTLSASAVKYLNSTLEETGLKFQNKMETGKVIVNVTVA